MKTLITFLAILLSASSLIAQSKDTIEIKKGLGTTFLYKGDKLNNKKLLSVLESNNTAYTELKSAQGSYTAGNICGFIGGALIGYQLGASIGGGKPNWAVAGVGGGFIVLGIPFSSSYLKKAKKAVAIYNGDVNKTAKIKTEFLPAITSNGIGLLVKF